MKMHVMSTADAVSRGFSTDKRKRRRQHRQVARQLSGYTSSTFRAVAAWHLFQARWVGR